MDVIGSDGYTPLIEACEYSHIWLRDKGWPVFQELERRSSDETRCAERNFEGVPEGRAADLLARQMTTVLVQRGPSLSEEEELRVQKRRRWAIAELLASGAPLRPDNAAALLPCSWRR